MVFQAIDSTQQLPPKSIQSVGWIERSDTHCEPLQEPSGGV